MRCNDGLNLCGLHDTYSNIIKWRPAWNNWCPCVFRSDKVADISSISQNSTPVVAITLPPELQEK